MPEAPKLPESGEPATPDTLSEKIKFLQENLKLSDEALKFLRGKGTTAVDNLRKSYQDLLESEKPLEDQKFKRFTQNEQYSWYKKEKIIGEKADDRTHFRQSLETAIQMAMQGNRPEISQYDALNGIIESAKTAAEEGKEMNQNMVALFTKINLLLPENVPKFIHNTDIPQLTQAELYNLLSPDSPKAMETADALRWIENNIKRNNLLSTLWGMKVSNFTKTDLDELSFNESGIKPEDAPFPMQQKEGVINAAHIMKYRSMDPAKALLILNKIKEKTNNSEAAGAEELLGK